MADKEEKAEAWSLPAILTVIGFALIALLAAVAAGVWTLALITQWSAYLLLLGAVLALVGLFGRLPEQWRHPCLCSGLVAAALGLIGLAILLLTPPGQAPVVKVPPKSPDPPPPRAPTLAEKLKQPWQTDDYPDWPVAEALATICQLGYQDPADARKEFDDLGFRSETIVGASMAGYVLLIDDTAVVVFRGTDDSPDWLQNLQVFSTGTNHGSIHSGFNASYQPLHSQIVKLLARFNPKRIWITGHSLGGALAVVCAYRLLEAEDGRIFGVMTFGQPMVARSDLRDYLQPKLRGSYVHFANGMDPVPRIMTPFQHFGTLILLQDGALYRSSELVAFGGPSSKGAGVFKPLTPREVSQLKSELRRSRPPKRQKPGELVAGDGWLPRVADHYMPEYIEMLRTIAQSRADVTEIPQE